MSVLSSISGLSSSAFSISGLATGLDTDKIIEGLLAANERRINQLRASQTTAVRRQTAFKGIEARLVTLQGSISSLSRSLNGVFQKKIATSSNEDLLTATATSSAAVGSHSFRVTSLAQPAQIASQGFDSADSLITQGTLQIRVGDGAAATITIDASNNTLQGLADAINAADGDVTATIVNDGSGTLTQPFRLLLTANKSGAANTIQVTDGLAADGGGAFKPVLTATYTGKAVANSTFTGTSALTSNAGAGTYTGTTNNTYTFTVVNGGTVGVDSGIQLSYTDKTGTNTGTITVDAADVDVFKNAAQGVQVKFGAGTLVAGETFTVDAFVPTVQQASSASVSLGSGDGAMTVDSDTNQITDLIPGITLNLLAADPSKTVTIDIANDVESAKKAVTDFVTAFNELMAFTDEQTLFDVERNIAGVLLGNRSAIAFQEEVRRAVTDVIPNVNSQMNRLSALGISLDDRGLLQIDVTKLDSVLNGEVDSVRIDDVRRLFALDGVSTNAGIRFITGSTKTRASATPYQVDVTQAAERATVTATTTLAASTVIDDTNSTLTLTLDGEESSTLTLASGTYTRQALAAELQALINADENLAGHAVTVTVDNDALRITSLLFGSASKVALGTGTALAPLGFTGSESDIGQDVAGKFLVDGGEEIAIGTGQLLLGNSVNANTADLQVRVTLLSSQIFSGSEADLSVTRGVASQLDQILNGMLDVVDGRLKSVNDGFQEEVDDFQAAIDQQNARTEAKKEELVRRFVALETTISRMRSISDTLTAQLASLQTVRR